MHSRLLLWKFGAKTRKHSNIASLLSNMMLKALPMLLLYSGCQIGLCTSLQLSHKVFRPITQALALDMALNKPEP